MWQYTSTLCFEQSFEEKSYNQVWQLELMIITSETSMTETCAKGGWQRNHINEWHFDVPSFSININAVSKSNVLICNIIPVHKHTTELSQCFRYITLPPQLPVLKQCFCCGGFENKLRSSHRSEKKTRLKPLSYSGPCELSYMHGLKLSTEKRLKT